MNNNAAKWAGSECEHVTFANSRVTRVKKGQHGHGVTLFGRMLIPAAEPENVLSAIVGSLERHCYATTIHHFTGIFIIYMFLWFARLAVQTCANEPAMISLSLGSRLTVHGRNISTSLAVRTGILEERKTSKLRMSPSISSSGSTSLVMGIFLEILRKKGKSERNNTALLDHELINCIWYIDLYGLYVPTWRFTLNWLQDSPLKT